MIDKRSDAARALDSRRELAALRKRKRELSSHDLSALNAALIQAEVELEAARDRVLGLLGRLRETAPRDLTILDRAIIATLRESVEPMSLNDVHGVIAALAFAVAKRAVSVRLRALANAGVVISVPSVARGGVHPRWRLG